MTPRQLLALSIQHRLTTEPEPEPQPEPSNKGSAGWLLAVAQGLERSRPRHAPVG